MLALGGAAGGFRLACGRKGERREEPAGEYSSARIVQRCNRSAGSAFMRTFPSSSDTQPLGAITRRGERGLR